MVPSKSEKKMNFGFVLMAGSVEVVILEEMCINLEIPIRLAERFEVIAEPPDERYHWGDCLRRPPSCGDATYMKG
jgi:hypothetical protein